MAVEEVPEPAAHRATARVVGRAAGTDPRTRTREAARVVQHTATRVEAADRIVPLAVAAVRIRLLAGEVEVQVAAGVGEYQAQRRRQLQVPAGRIELLVEARVGCKRQGGVPTLYPYQTNRLASPCQFIRSSHTCWTGRGQPTAARIMSLVHPAQQMHLRGSSIEIERLSPLRSCPSSAQDGHRVTLLCPTV